MLDDAAVKIGAGEVGIFQDTSNTLRSAYPLANSEEFKNKRIWELRSENT